jgi:hypothetical protein
MTTPSMSAATVNLNLSDTLADQSTNKMTTAPSTRNSGWMKAYMETLINPFSTTLKSPKLLDGEIKNTAAIKLRATGEIVCSATVNTNIILFPGLTNVICYCNQPTGLDNTANPDTTNVLIDGAVFKKHLSTVNDRAAVRVARLSGAGARFFLTNSAEEDDGYWEACRLTNHHAVSDFFFKNDNAGNLGAGVVKALSTDFDLANNVTYQFGQLRDIHKYVFKLNSEDNDHKYSAVSGINTAVDLGLNNADALADIDQWDMVFIKVRGRRNALSPSVLRFDTVANTELVYAEDSPLARMMEESPRDPNIDGFLSYSRVELPAFQASG